MQAEVTGTNNIQTKRREAALSKASKAAMLREYDAIAMIRRQPSGDDDCGNFLMKRKRTVERSVEYHSRLDGCDSCRYCGDDLRMAGMEGMLRALYDYRPVASFLNFARYYVANSIQKELQSQCYLMFEDVGADFINTIPSGENIMDEIERRENAVIVRQAIDKLPEKLKKVVILRFYAGKTLAETGSELHINKESVRQREAKALVKMRKMLVKEGYSY